MNLICTIEGCGHLSENRDKRETTREIIMKPTFTKGCLTALILSLPIWLLCCSCAEKHHHRAVREAKSR